MSVSSSSPVAASSPPIVSSPTTRKHQQNCTECKRLKRACNKGLPCDKCLKADRTCEYRDPSDDGILGPISAAKDIHSLTFGTLLDVLVNKPRVKEAVSMYFNGVNSWFTIVERATFDRDLEANWGSLKAETSVLALCMALVTYPPNQRTSKGMGDTAYPSTKAIMTLIRSKNPPSLQLLQAELLVALYEFSHSMPHQACLSLGTCLQMTKTFGWHKPDFWSPERQISKPAELKLCSILWWAIVYLDCLLNIADQDQTYTMYTPGLPWNVIIPLPENFDTPFGHDGEVQGFRDRHNDHIEGMVFPEATAACYLRDVLQHLSNPGIPNAIDSKLIIGHAKDLWSAKWQAGDRSAAVGADFLALMKLNYPGLMGMHDPMEFLMPNPSHTQAVSNTRTVIEVIHGKAGKLLQADNHPNKSSIDPCWALAMCQAALLLVWHGDDVFGDSSWRQKVTTLKMALDKVSRTWKVAEHFSTRVQIAVDHRHTGHNAKP
ncbi:uncharacterized protein C8A04DRAFT_24378 [Dichotomopilus funicola]|uniref:Zn(2)-C6 fungal-type domain-containing protein n=1 Tax=Dichotomopilus funicola TaxID=1934379 RepID=A0AAN6VAD2_9PEZI|nr:hypothetical protein C8A04DRAFT_24378 [Dichotomopilus funicola]